MRGERGGRCGGEDVCDERESYEKVRGENVWRLEK